MGGLCVMGDGGGEGLNGMVVRKSRGVVRLMFVARVLVVLTIN